MFKAIWTDVATDYGEEPIEATGATVDEALRALEQTLRDAAAKRGLSSDGDPPLEWVPSVDGPPRLLIGCDMFIVGHIEEV